MNQPKCPSCFNPIQRGWAWCHTCGYDPDGLNPEGGGPSAPPSGARPNGTPDAAEPDDQFDMSPEALFAPGANVPGRNAPVPNDAGREQSFGPSDGTGAAGDAGHCMLKLTVRGLRAHLVRLMLTGLVVLMGVAFVGGSQMLTDTVRTGFDQVFSSRYAGTDVAVRSSDSIFTFGGQQRAPVSEDVLGAAQGTPGVRAAEGVVQAPLRLIGKDGKAIANPSTVALQSYGLNWRSDPQLNQWRITGGRPPSGESEVVVDEKFATDNGFVLGDELRIPFAQGTVPFTIVGTARFQNNPNYSGSNAVLFDTPTAQRYLVGEDRFNWVAIATEPSTAPSDVQAGLQRVLSSSGPLQVLTGDDFARDDQDVYQRVLGLLNMILAIFGVVALFVSSFVIYNTFSLIVAQRTRELALLRALGAGRRQILRSVLAEAVVVGAIAAFLGIGAGVLFGAAISWLLTSIGLAPTNGALVLKPGAFVPAFAMGVVVTIAAMLFPAWRASRIPPIAAMRDYAVEPTASSRARTVVGGLMTAIGAGLLFYGLTGRGAGTLVYIGFGTALVFLGVAVLGPVVVTPIAAALGLLPARLSGITGVLARENTRRNPKRTAATTSAVMVAVALVAFIAIVGESFRAATAEAVDLSVVGDFVVNGPTVGFAGVSPEVTRRLNAQPSVQAAASFRVGVGLADGQPSLFFGIDPARLQQVVKFDVPEGSLQGLGDDGVAVSKRVAETNRWSVGSPVLVHFLAADDGPAPASTTTTTTPGATAPGPAPATAPPVHMADRVLFVRAIFESELLRGSSGLLVSQELFEQGFPGVQNTDLQVYVKLNPGVAPAVARADLEPIVALFPPAELQDLSQFKRAQTAPVDRFVTFVWALLLLAVLISAIGILNTLLLAVHERTRELGLLHAAGMSRQQVRVSIRWEAVVISIIGTLLGLSVGVFFVWAFVHALAEDGLRTFAIPTAQLAMIIALAGVIGIVAAFVPARRAANLDVLDAIASE